MATAAEIDCLVGESSLFVDNVDYILPSTNEYFVSCFYLRAVVMGFF